MARELNILINAVDQGAKAALKGIDDAMHATTTSTQRTSAAIVDLEAKLALARAQMNVTGAAMKRVADQAIGGEDAYQRLKGKLADTTKEFLLARNVVAGYEEQIKGASTASTGFGSALEMVAGVSVAGAAIALLGLVKSTAQYAQQLQATSEETGLGVETLQRYSYMASQASVPTDTLAHAVAHLHQALYTQGTESVRAMRELGLTFTQLKTLAPEQQLDLVAQRLAQVTDHTRRAAESETLLGSNVLPIIANYDELKRKAEDLETILTSTQTKALADVGRKWDELTTKAKGYFAEIAAKALQPSDLSNSEIEKLRNPATGQIDLSDAWQVDRQRTQMQAGLKPPPLAQSAPLRGGPDLSSPTPETQRQIALLEASEKVLNDMLREQLTLTERLEAFRKEARAARLADNKQIVAELRQQSQAYLEVSNAAVQAELNAREANNKARGRDIRGNPIDESPLTQANKALDKLHRESAQSLGVSTSEREAQINREFLEATLKAAQANDHLADSATNAAVASDKVATGHLTAEQAALGAAVAVGDLGASAQGASQLWATIAGQQAQSFNHDLLPVYGAGGFLGYGPTGGRFSARASGGPVAGGQPYMVGEQGPELFVPGGNGSIVPHGAGGVGNISITIHGNVDSELTARRMADQVAAKIMDRLKSQQRFSLTKA